MVHKKSRGSGAMLEVCGSESGSFTEAQSNASMGVMQNPLGQTPKLVWRTDGRSEEPWNRGLDALWMEASAGSEFSITPSKCFGSWDKGVRVYGLLLLLSKYQYA